MIESLIGADNLPLAVLQLLQRLIIVLIALTVHEVAHGWVALKLGDDTAAKFGRLSLNPAKHLDPWGFICMLLFGFGWAKPVPIRAGRFKNPRRGMALSALAGPISNLLLAVLIFIPLEIVTLVVFNGTVPINSQFSANLTVVLFQFMYLFASMNVSLAIFNFLPIPPLDGSRILYAFLPDKIYFGVMKYERVISVVIMVLLLTGLLDYPLSWLVGTVLNGIDFIIPII